MIRGTTLPPQAYTREMLTQAYQWLHTQPESIKKLANSADALVGLYLRAQRNGFGESSLETTAPVSTEDFRQSLKSLKEEMHQFDMDRAPSQVLNGPMMSEIPSAVVPPPASMQQPIHHPQASAPQTLSSQQMSTSISPLAANSSPLNSRRATFSAAAQAPMAQVPAAQTTNVAPTPTSAPVTSAPVTSATAPTTQVAQTPAGSPAQVAATISFSLDTKTYANLKGVKERFNLSSEQEALRMLVSLGVEKLNQI